MLFLHDFYSTVISALHHKEAKKNRFIEGMSLSVLG